MNKYKKITLISMLSLLLIVLTACGLKLNNETLASDGGVYKVGEEIWKFQKDGNVQIYKANGEQLDSNIKYTYKIKDKEKNYLLTLNQDFEQKGEDYKITLSQEMVIKINKKKQNIKHFEGVVQSVAVKDSQIESDIPEIKEGLEQNFSADSLNKKLNEKVGSKITFDKQDKNYLADKIKTKTSN